MNSSFLRYFLYAIVVVAFSVSKCAAATDTLTIFYDAVWNETADHATYMRKAWKQDKLWQVRDYYLLDTNNGHNSAKVAGQVQMTGAFIDDSLKTKQGPFNCYYKSGKLSSMLEYKLGKLDGLSEEWYANDQVHYTASYKNGELHGKGKWYFENGQISAEETNSMGKKTQGIYWNEKGKKLSHLSEHDIQAMPEFNGDVSAYLSTHLHYPDSARAAGIEGRVILDFVIDEDGAVTKVEVKQKINDELDAEACRVVHSMPHWRAGIEHHLKVSVYFRLPISFKLE